MLLIQIPVAIAVAFILRRQSRAWFGKNSVVNHTESIDTSSVPYGKDRYALGLKNLGNTCYMNSILQSLFHTYAYRQNVLEGLFCNGTSGKELQKLFMSLMGSTEGRVFCDTSGVAAALGINVNVQEDSEELFLKIVDHVDKSTEPKGSSDLGQPSAAIRFETEQTIRCVKVNYKSQKIISNLDISLDFKGHPDLQSALKAHFTPELLEGESQYRAGPHGLQDAEKGILLVPPLPPVLAIHLKRFSFDLETLDMQKIVDPLEIPLALNLGDLVSSAAEDRPSTMHSSSAGMALAPGLERSTSRDTDSDTTVVGRHSESDFEYELSSIVVHEGSLDFGHYFCLARLPDDLDVDVDDVDVWVQEEGVWVRDDPAETEKAMDSEAEAELEPAEVEGVSSSSFIGDEGSGEQDEDSDEEGDVIDLDFVSSHSDTTSVGSTISTASSSSCCSSSSSSNYCGSKRDGGVRGGQQHLRHRLTRASLSSRFQPRLAGRWVMLNDESVTLVDEKQVLDLARGVASADGRNSRNAYMLFYTKRRGNTIRAAPTS